MCKKCKMWPAVSAQLNLNFVTEVTKSFTIKHNSTVQERE